MGPFVLIVSYGSTKPIEIVQKLHSNNLNSPQNIEIEETTFPTYDYSIKNKYFETVVKLLPFEGPINTIPVEILKGTEAFIVAFESKDKSFLNRIPELCDLVEKYNIELGLLVTSEIGDDINEELSYGDLKEACKTSFDVIETHIKDEEENFSEIVEALENHVWSNVASSSGAKKESKAAVSAPTVVAEAAEAETDELDDDQLEAYGNLLADIVNFKENSSNLNRDQLFDQAEKLAQMFENFMGED